MSILLEMWEYPFMVRALAVGLLVSLCAALLGVSLVLKRYSMIGDGLSHVAFGAMAVAVAVGWAPLLVAIPVVMVAAFLLLRLGQNSRVRGDAAIGMLSAVCLALGVTVLSLSSQRNVDIQNYMFGSILSMSSGDVTLSVVLSIVVMILFAVFYNRIFAVTFDETFARATGTKAGIYNMLIALLTALTIVLGMRMMGAMLISSLIIFPALTSMRVCKRFRSVIICSAVVSAVCFFAGISSSYALSTPAGASVVVANLVAFLIFAAVGAIRDAMQLRLDKA